MCKVLRVEMNTGLPLVMQWIRIHLPMQGHRFDPWSGRISHASEQLSPWATTTEPVHLEPMRCKKRGHCSEKLKYHK